MVRVSDWVKTHKRHAAALVVALLAAICLAVAGMSCSTTALTPQPAQEAEGGSSEPGKTESPEPDEEPEAGDVEAETEGGNQGESTAPSTEPSDSAAEPPATSKSESPAESGGGTSGGQASAHTHTWKDHTATRQVWVSNMVTVPDYEDQRVFSHYLYVFSYDGYSTTDINEVKAHSLELLKSGVDNTNYTNVPQYTWQTVQVGSHEEDQGWYETQTYVDYQYCDCGARK